MSTTLQGLDPTQPICVVYREGSLKAVRVAEHVRQSLGNQGYQIMLAPEQKPIADSWRVAKEAEYVQSQLVIAIGGDGTFLRAHRLFGAHTPAPILGIHAGHLGFLTCHESESTPELLQALLNSELELHERPRLEGEVLSPTGERRTFFAINDVVLERGGRSHLLPIQVSSNNRPLAMAKADGVILASPLGSTAYNLAVGGPLVHPDVDHWVLSFIAPHTLSLRSLVLPSTQAVSLCLPGSPSGGDSAQGNLVVDGQIITSVKEQETVSIRKSPVPLRILRQRGWDEISLWAKKLGWQNPSPSL
jgi:NAD+ kinase